jgi:hypothetical protein
VSPEADAAGHATSTQHRSTLYGVC